MMVRGRGSECRRGRQGNRIVPSPAPPGARGSSKARVGVGHALGVPSSPRFPAMGEGATEWIGPNTLRVSADGRRSEMPLFLGFIRPRDAAIR